MRLLITVSFIVAFVMSTFPIHVKWYWLRPEFVALMVIYWSIYATENFGIFAAWCLGLLQDIVEFGLLGQNALVLAIIAYICQISHKRILHYTVWQQAGCVCLLLIIYLTFDHWITGITAYEKGATPFFLSSALITAFIWPLIVFLGEKLVNQSALYKSRN